MGITDILVTGEPIIYAAMVSIALVSIAIPVLLTYFKKWGWLWREWLTTVDHKKIGVMYILSALLMLFRGGMDALMMRVQLAFPDLGFLDSQHYNEIFTTHGTVMIIFMAMPFLIGLMNIVVPLQIGARDFAFPWLNAMSFWSFFIGAMLFNISFVIGGSPDAGWTSYTPLSGAALSPGPGQNFYLMGLQLSGIGTLATGINLMVTILKMRAPGMKLFHMPIFTWSTLVTCFIIVFAFPILTVALALLTIDRIFGAHFFTLTAEGLPMMWANLFWMWGHPEVYIVILPAFGIFSEIIATFAKKRLFGYHAMVWSMIIIALLSFLVWVHHFFTMGAGAFVNSVFSVSTMLIAVPTGVKIFNWLATLYKSKIEFTVPMLWSLAFIPSFILGGVTGVMLGMAAADYQFHNSYFLVAHFHYVLIAGTVFACFAGLVFWYPKMFGHKMNERLGKWAFWIFFFGFHVCFFPQYFLGLDGMPRRLFITNVVEWLPLNVISTVGAFGMGLGFIVFVYNVYYSFRHAEREKTGDSWNGNGRTLEWATTTPVPFYNFATVPYVDEIDPYVRMKEEGKTTYDESQLKPIHMPSYKATPIIMMTFLGLGSFGLVFEWMPVAIFGLIGGVAVMILRSFDYDDGYYVSVEEIKRIERKARGL
ncbi:cytochrome aa3 quinol oxidase subunit I [Halobacillus litoralis]|uniref:Quinol oxidase subunit 1 n=1 Tax=Halobacillus litoralis TaxID=45668 RepID=A0A845DQM5_9BACI|nr:MULTISPECIES: cytochrome aa3 quinol oxidase subunit I [Halobacillus]MCA1023771.1 cytochrome aa3 quinol oxidase subunit I [Halobacillus litoralis]MYL18682.1 cytochrome aa3 quinol oxidase subunit I [Halobacillus litoralis]MYL31574.1 cytochrome aa3 quinol oxidase subunit I [Halobacillus halophilus]MYL39119.1 cytochrome aa3 quinol oxidase subunit I [Halobacillus litoralis]